jgi:hypothetical protein
MTISDKNLMRYNLLKERGDVPALMATTGLSRASIYNILTNGKCSVSVALKFKKHFEKKAVAVTQLEDQD